MRNSRFRRTLGLVTTASVAAASLVACSSHDQTAPPAAAAPSAWQSVLNQIQPDGTVTTATALSAFALAIGPVPGAVKPAGGPDVIFSGTLAVHWVLQHWKDLDAAQHTAVLTDLGVPTSSNAPADYVITPADQAVPPPADPDVPCLTADSGGSAKYRTMLTGVESAVAAKLGRPLTVAAGTFVSLNTKDLERTDSGQLSLMYTLRCTKPNTDTTSGCTIHINPATDTGGYSDDMLRSFLIHEVTHCFLDDKFGAAYDTMPAWYVEGVPTWTMSVLGVGNDRLSSKWTGYLDTPTKPLTQRSYDAVGFFAHLAETGTDPWRIIDPVGTALLSGGSPAGFAAAGVTPDFLSSWGSGYVQGRYPGKAWTSSGPNLPPYQPALPGGRFGNGATLNLTSPAFAAAAEQVDVDATVVLVNPGPGTAGRISIGGGADSTVDTGNLFCTMAQCGCPDGSAGAGTTFTHLASGQEYVGFSAGAKAGALSLVGMSLPDYCAKPPVSCLVGSWTGVNFDVHAANITETGGAGVKLHIDAKGNLSVVFDGMKPITFTQSGGTGVEGTLVYSGSVSGVIKLPAGGVTSGNWDYASAASIRNLTATVHLSSPFETDIGPIDVAQLAGVGGGAVSSHPVVTGGWSCSGTTLTTTPPPNDAVAGTWTLTRTGPA